MTYHDLVEQGQQWLGSKYKGYWKLPGRERRVLAAAWLNDIVKPREKTGRNDGPVVQAILQSSGLQGDFAWCAASQNLIALVSMTWHPEKGSASVARWRNEARAAHKSIPVSAAKRGDLLTKNYGGGKGHIEIKIRGALGLVWTMGGNTSPDENGDQREGQGFYRRIRRVKWFDDAIKGE